MKKTLRNILLRIASATACLSVIGLRWGIEYLFYELFRCGENAQKTAIKNRITKESLFPRYVLCTVFASKYSTAVQTTMRQAFKADCEMLGVTLFREADGKLSDLYSSWNI